MDTSQPSHRPDDRPTLRFRDAVPFDQLPPQNLEAELCVLGGLLLDNTFIDDVAGILKPADFYRDAHGRLYEAILALHGTGSPVDGLLLSESLLSDPGALLGDADELIHEAMEKTPHAANTTYYAQIIRQVAVARELIETSQETIRRAYSRRFAADDLLADAESRLFGIADARDPVEAAPVGPALDEALAHIATRAGGEVVGVRSGFREVDETIGGFQAGTLTIVAGRPSMGKSAWVLNLIERAATFGSRCLLVSLEMGRVEVGTRLLQARAMVEGHRLKNAWTLGDDERARILFAARTLRSLPISIDDGSTRTISEIASCARRIRRRKGLDLIVIDYLQLVAPEESRDPRQEQVAKISRRMKQVAKDLGVPVIALSQLNRLVEGRDDHRPRMSDLRESGAIEQDADAVLFLHRPAYYDPNDQPGLAELIVAKNRQGQTGTVALAWSGQHMRFDTLAPHDATGPDF